MIFQPYPTPPHPTPPQKTGNDLKQQKQKRCASAAAAMRSRSAAVLSGRRGPSVRGLRI